MSKVKIKVREWKSEVVDYVCDVDDNDFNIIDAYSFHSHSLHQESFGSIYTKPILNKISSVKNGVDYDRKTLKINRFRFSIHYNEFDPDKVTEVFMGKVVHLINYLILSNLTLL